MVGNYDSTTPPPSFQFPSPLKQFIPERDIFFVVLENGESYVFKPDRPEDEIEERESYSSRAELAVYERFKHLQGTCIPICYGVVTLRDQVGLLLQDCGRKSLLFPPKDDEISKFLLYMRAKCVVQKCLESGFIHPDMEFQNIVYDPDTLQVRLIDIEPVRYANYTPQDIWKFMSAGFAESFGYGRESTKLSWGLSKVLIVLRARPWDGAIYLLILRFCFCQVKKKITMRNAGPVWPPISNSVPLDPDLDR